MDKIYIKNYIITAKHGYYKEEHAKSQRFVVDVIATCDTKKSAENDDLKQTLNYEHIRKYIHETLIQSPRHLLESLAEEIAEKVLSHTIVNQVEVSIQKPDVWTDCIPGITILRKK